MIRTWFVLVAFGACNNVGSNNPFCDGNDCVCPPATPCAFECQPDSQCDVQTGVGSTVTVQCLATETCEVECHNAASCRVDCAGRNDCQVTCPSGACTVTNIPETDPNVSCGGAPASRTATTASCP
jgi:hypothetical protein